MAKQMILLVKACEFCLGCQRNSAGEAFCTITGGKKIKDTDTISNWCPLPDAPEGAEKIGRLSITVAEDK